MTNKRPGNCNMGKYNSYKTPMLLDETPCGPWCPPGGKCGHHGCCLNIVLFTFWPNLFD